MKGSHNGQPRRRSTARRSLKWNLEEMWWAEGRYKVAGVDEAGRGPLAGPVVAAAIVLPKGFDPAGIDDSKRLTSRQREEQFRRLCEEAEAWEVAVVDVETIDRLNILEAARLAMRRAVEGLGERCDAVLIDGLPVPGLTVPNRSVVRGDSQSPSIAAASILAKVTRDRLMLEYAKQYPEYGFDRHMGYPTAEHLEALRRYGPCPIHRRSFRPVAELLGTCSASGNVRESVPAGWPHLGGGPRKE
ncbi:MAG: ribonuclease HII [Alicyclobacillaceae bacterium]|nr:ribonuclease HII [Alicyclobacillaceae bacterium]